MTARQRLLTALRRAQPDRVPVTIYEQSIYNDEWPNREPSYTPLLELEREYGDTIVFMPAPFPVFFGPAADIRGATETQADVRSVTETQADGSKVTTTTYHTPRGPLRSVSRLDPGLMTGWQLEPLIKCDADIAALLSLPDPPVEIDAAALRAWDEKVGENALLCLGPGDAIGRVVGMFDYQDFVKRCHKDDGPVRALLAVAQERLVRAVRAVGAVLKNQIIRLWGPEYCGAPLMNPRIYFRRYVVEQDQQLTRAIHETGNFSVIHCHGRLRDLLDMILEIGADALEPIETLPMPTADVTLAEIKERIGHRMCLMGAIQARTLETGTAEDMRREVRAAIQAAAPGGGFVLLPTSAPFMVPLTARCLENARVMYETAHEYGGYG